MRKIVWIGLSLLILLSLGACYDAISLADALDQVEVTFAEGDSFESVTTDVVLTEELVGFDEITLTWTSSHPDIIDSKGSVNRPLQTTNVILTAKVKYENRQRSKDFVFTVISINANNPEMGSYILETYFESIDSDAYTLESSLTLYAELDTEITLSETYTGFVVNAELSDLTAIVTEEIITIKHYYDRLTYEILFMDEEDEISRETLKYGSTVDFPEELIKEGYQLTGWTTDQAGEQLFNPSTTVTSNLTLYTKWTVISNSLEDLDYTGYGDYYLLLNDSDNVIHDLAILLRDTIDYVSYGDARYVYATYDNDSQVIMYDVPSSTSYRKVPATGTLGWGSGGVITTSEFTISINREHIWACSDMRIMPINKDKTLDGYVEFVINNDVNSFNYRPGNNDRGHYTDLHNLWNALAGPNGTHSDHFYGEESGPSIASYLSNDIFYPGDEYRGDVARALFYMTLMYPHLTLVERGDPNANEGSIYYGYLEDLLRWNEEDPVSYYELERNNTIFNEQGNRNPFIDLYDLDFAELLFAEGDPNVLD